MSNDRLVRQILEIAERTGISYNDVAAAAGVSPSTVRHTFGTGKPPERSAARASLQRFAEQNAAARLRSEVRFV
jgi:AcrR family transcriptional regulator